MRLKYALLTLNAGSSTLKFKVFTSEDCLSCAFSGVFDHIHSPQPTAVFHTHSSAHITQKKLDSPGYSAALSLLYSWLSSRVSMPTLRAVVHRIVHGGRDFIYSTRIDTDVLKRLHALSPLAPLHQPPALAIIEQAQTLWPKTPHLACFDTSFHSSLPSLARRLPLPESFLDQGIERYGFHGLSYSYISSILHKYAGNKALGNVIVAHLGSGSSLCAMKNKQSIATSMGFSALDGLMMSTRSGTIDPGVLLYLLEHRGYTPGELSDLLYNQSGLLGVSGESGDMRELLEKRQKPAVRDALDLYCSRVSEGVSSLCVPLGGLDVLVFTAGIGVNTPFIRAEICKKLGFLGVEITPSANDLSKNRISHRNSRVLVLVIPTDEEHMMALEALVTLEAA